MATDSPARALALAALAYKEEHAQGNYNEIKNKPKINGVELKGSHDANYYKLPVLAETGHSISFSMDSEYVLTLKLLNKDGAEISYSTVDLPIESLIMDGRYEEDSEGKGYLILVLQNGNEISIPLEGLIDELATKEYVDEQDLFLRTHIDSEVLRLDAAIDSEGLARISGDSELWVALGEEETLRIEGDSELEEQIITLRGQLDSEAVIREQEDLKLRADLDSEAVIRLAEDTNLKNLLDSEVSIRENQYIELSASIDSEAQAREDQDIVLAFLIDSEGQIREEQFRLFRQDFEAEVAARIAGDSELDAKIDQEILDRAYQDNLLQTQITNETTARTVRDTELQQAISAEASTRQSKDIELQTLISGKQDTISVVGPISKLGSQISLKYDNSTLVLNNNGELEAVGGGSAVQSYLNGVLLDSEATSISAKIYWYGTQAEYDALDSEAQMDPNTLYFIESSEGRPITWTKSYTELQDKPQINGVTLSGDKTLSSFGIQPTMTGTNPISVSGNTVSLRYNENQFYIGADNKLSFNDKDPSFDAAHIITFRAGFVGILGGMNCTKFNNGLYVGNLKFMNEEQVPTGDITIGGAFGDGGNTFNGYCIGFDETNHVPITFEVVDGELHMYNNNVIPSRRYITVPFTFVL